MAGLHWLRTAFGKRDTTRRASFSAGGRLAKEWHASASFSCPEEIEVPPGQIVLFYSMNEFEGIVETCRVNSIEALVEGFRQESATWSDSVDVAFRRFLMSRPWGALYRAVFRPHASDYEMRVAEGRALLEHWDELAVARYPIKGDRNASLDNLVARTTFPMFNAWCPGLETETARARLTCMVNEMWDASRSRRQEAVASQVRRVLPDVLEMISDSESRRRAQALFTDRAYVAEALTQLEGEEWRKVESADEQAALGFMLAQCRRLGLWHP